jgi:predicted 3-demethylubiquinone-9 3-methyltransferase (glyoxalase superfamily)
MTHPQRITPHLWYDREAREAAEFYTRIFPNSRITQNAVMDDTPSGSVDMLVIELMGQEFSMISAGPMFKFTPAVSFLVQLHDKDEVNALWAALIEGGTALMSLDRYPFSERYGWLSDRYGLSWQIMYAPAGSARQSITPMLMFVGEQYGKAEEAIRFYTSIFRDARVNDIMRYGSDEAPDAEGNVKRASFTLEGTAFEAIESAHQHDFSFTEAISFMVYCDDQAEIDHYWEKLSAVPEAEACGWLKDKYGVSWQIVPRAMNAMMSNGTPQQIARVTQAFLAMKKFDLAALQRAYDGV